MMLVSAAAPVAAACGLLYYASVRNKRKKSPPLPRSEKVSIELLLLVTPSHSSSRGRGRSITMHVHLPSNQFIANMKKAVIKERNSLMELWDSEQDVFRRVWDEDYNYYRRYSFIQSLLMELEANIDSYSDSGKLSEYLCPHLYDTQKLLSRVNTDINEGNEDESEHHHHGYGMNDLIRQVVHDSNDKNHIFNSISVVVLKANIALDEETSTGTADSDTTCNNSKLRLDLDLSMRVESFLFTLKQLCMVMFVKQFLARYLSSEPPANAYVRLYRLLGNRYVCGLLIFIAFFALDTSGLLSKIVPNYESLFLLKDLI